MLYLQIASPKSSVLNFLDSNSFEVIISIFQRTEKVPDMERLRGKETAMNNNLNFMFGAIAVLMMFILLIWRCMIIANNAPDLFGALLVVGVMGHIAIQVILNVAVVTNTIPNTGISLPFISYGGSSVMFLLAEIGIVFSVGRGIRLKDL